MLLILLVLLVLLDTDNQRVTSSTKAFVALLMVLLALPRKK